MAALFPARASTAPVVDDAAGRTGRRRRPHPVRFLRAEASGPYRRDYVLALVVGLVAVTTLAVVEKWDYWMPVHVGTYWCALWWTVLALALRRRAPRLDLWLVAIGYPVVYSTVTDGGRLQSTLHLVPLLIVVFAGARAAVHRIAVVLAIGLVSGFVLLAGLSGAFRETSRLRWSPQFDLSAGVVVGAAIVATAAVGHVLHRLDVTTSTLAQRNAELLALQEVHAQEAVRDERTRIARELHDVVAHYVSAIVVRAQAADRVADAQPDAPREAVRWIAPAGREALDAMRSVVRVLRTADDETAPLDPTPDLHALPQVVARVRAAGLRVEAELPDELPPCSPAVGLAVVRVAQEALTNVLVHSAAVSATLRLSSHDGSLVLDVQDPGPPRPPAPGTGAGGNGVPHMRERAAACGGTLLVGPGDRGGWRVLLVVPEAV
ncbi:sensor histidine kinase [Cellulomonas composti]|uniref:histidine kinase n=1 Tax=Cellulomonas composti TaxID=266130 RepID=A0A511JEJ3_9CELL|nr:histidine kinase [Cellulomonas composti]GEL96427.1 two-component sensor histidine kinase [Cellulomonas composti]